MDTTTTTSASNDTTLVERAHFVLIYADCGKHEQAVAVAGDMIDAALKAMRVKHQGRSIPGCSAIALGQAIGAVAEAFTQRGLNHAKPGALALHHAAVDAAHKASAAEKALRKAPAGQRAALLPANQIDRVPA